MEKNAFTSKVIANEKEFLFRLNMKTKCCQFKANWLLKQFLKLNLAPEFGVEFITGFEIIPIYHWPSYEKYIN